MQLRSNHVVPSKSNGGWAVRKSGAMKATKGFTKKEDAIKYARLISRKEKTELYIHRRDGSIQDRNSYVTRLRPTG